MEDDIIEKSVFCNTNNCIICSICQDIILPIELIYILSCGHYYHISCIKKWFDTDNYTCPECRYEVKNKFLNTVIDNSNNRRVVVRIIDRRRHRCDLQKIKFLLFVLFMTSSIITLMYIFLHQLLPIYNNSTLLN